MKKLSHRQVCGYLQAEALPDEAAQAQIERHLATCLACREYAALVADLETARWNPFPRPRLRAAEKTQLTQVLESRIRRKKMHNRVLNPVKSLAWITAALAFLGALYWLLPGTFSPPEPAVPAAVSVDPVDRQTAAPQETPPMLPTPTPVPVELIPLLITPTPAPEREAVSQIELGYRPQTEVVLVDLDCNGTAEKLLTRYWVSTNPAEVGRGLRDYTAVEIKKLDGNGVFQTAWKSDFEHSPREARYGVALFTISDCEQLIARSSWDGSHGAVGRYRTQIYRWDGTDMVTVLDVPESLMDLRGVMMLSTDAATQPFKLRTVHYGYPDPNKGTCDYVTSYYAWDGAEFILVERHTEADQPCNGAGG